MPPWSGPSVLEELVKFVGGGAVLLGCVAWLLRSLTVHLLNKDIARFQEHLRAEVQRREFVFSRYHDKRIEIVAELYRRMVSAKRVVEQYVTAAGALSTPPHEASNVVASFRDYYEEHRIWFDKGTRDLVDALINEHSLFYRFANASQLQQAGLGKDWIPQEIPKLWKAASESLPLAQERLEARFRELVGHEENGQA